MEAEWIPDQKQFSECQRKLRKNIKSEEKVDKYKLMQKTEDWDYGPHPQKKDKNGNPRPLGAKTIYQRIDTNIFRNELSNIITNYDENDDIYKTASYLLGVTKSINFWLLKGVNDNGDKIFYDHDNDDIILYKQQLLAEFNLSSQIGQCWDVINDRLYGCKLCVYYEGNEHHGSWIKVIDRDAFAVAFGVTLEYRMSYCPAILVDIGGIGLMMVLSGSAIINNQKHVGFGFCNIIKKKRKTVKQIDGHSMIHILQENKHDVYVQFYAVNNANINAADIEVILEPHNLKKNDNNNKREIILFPIQNNVNNGMIHNVNNMTINSQMNINDITSHPEMMNNNMNDMNVSSMNIMGNNPNIIPNQMRMNMMNPNIRHPPFIDNQFPLNMNNREYNQPQPVQHGMSPNQQQYNHNNMVPNTNNNISPQIMGINEINNVNNTISTELSNTNINNMRIPSHIPSNMQIPPMPIPSMSIPPMPIPPLPINQQLISTQNTTEIVIPPLPFSCSTHNQQTATLDLPEITEDTSNIGNFPRDFFDTQSVVSTGNDSFFMGYSAFHRGINWDISSMRYNPLRSTSTNTFDTCSNY